MKNPEAVFTQKMSLQSHEVRIHELDFNSPVHLPFGTIHTRPSAWLTLNAITEGSNTMSQGAAEGTALPMQIPMYDDCSSNLKTNIEYLMEPFYERAEFTFSEVVDLVRDTELYGKYSTARMTVETAFLDLLARSSGLTVYEMLTGKKPDHFAIPYGKSIAETDSERNYNAALAAFANGAKRLKFKISPTNAHEVIDAIQRLKKMGNNVDYMVDANGSFDPNNDADIEILEHIDQLGLMMIEEPVSRAGETKGLDAHFLLRDRVRLVTPVALDDSIASEIEARVALEEGVGEILNLKPGRVGSFIRCIEMAHLAKDLGKQIMVGGMFEATPGRSMTLTLAAYCIELGFTIPGDVSLPQERLINDLVEPNLKLDSDHNVMFSPTLGWGYELHE